MANPYIPRQDRAAGAWMVSFARGLVNDPERYAVTLEEAEAVQEAVDRFVEALPIALAAGTRTRVTTEAKNHARFVAEQLIQNYYVPIKANRAISDADKLAIGVRPINSARTRIQCPQTQPFLEVSAYSRSAQKLRFTDTLSDRKAKPEGATQIQIVREIHDGPLPLHGPDDAKILGQFTRNPIRVIYGWGDDRKKATYWARWVSRRGETGPWSLPASMSIAA
jgi:hypothetical protein